jgi:hypothetical protein
MTPDTVAHCGGNSLRFPDSDRHIQRDGGAFLQKSRPTRCLQCFPKDLGRSGEIRPSLRGGLQTPDVGDEIPSLAVVEHAHESHHRSAI